MKIVREHINELKILKGPSDQEVINKISDVSSLKYAIEKNIKVPKEKINKTINKISDIKDLLEIKNSSLFDNIVSHKKLNEIVSRIFNISIEKLTGPFDLNIAEQLFKIYIPGELFEPSFKITVVKNDGNILYYFTQIGGDIYSIDSLNKNGKHSYCQKTRYDFIKQSGKPNYWYEDVPPILKWIEDRGWEEDKLRWISDKTFKTNIGLFWWSLGVFY